VNQDVNDAMLSLGLLIEDWQQLFGNGVSGRKFLRSLRKGFESAAKEMAAIWPVSGFQSRRDYRPGNHFLRFDKSVHQFQWTPAMFAYHGQFFRLESQRQP